MGDLLYGFVVGFIVGMLICFMALDFLSRKFDKINPLNHAWKEKP